MKQRRRRRKYRRKHNGFSCTNVENSRNYMTSDDDVVECTGLTRIVRQPICSADLLDRVFISNPQLYRTVRVMSPLVKSDQKAVVAMSSEAAMSLSTKRDRNAGFGREHRRRTQAFCSMTWRRLTSPDQTPQSTTHSTLLHSDYRWKSFILSAQSR